MTAIPHTFKSMEAVLDAKEAEMKNKPPQPLAGPKERQPTANIWNKVEKSPFYACHDEKERRLAACDASDVEFYVDVLRHLILLKDARIDNRFNRKFFERFFNHAVSWDKLSMYLYDCQFKLLKDGMPPKYTVLTDPKTVAMEPFGPKDRKDLENLQKWIARLPGHTASSKLTTHQDILRHRSDPQPIRVRLVISRVTVHSTDKYESNWLDVILHRLARRMPNQSYTHATLEFGCWMLDWECDGILKLMPLEEWLYRYGNCVCVAYPLGVDLDEDLIREVSETIVACNETQEYRGTASHSLDFMLDFMTKIGVQFQPGALFKDYLEQMRASPDGVVRRFRHLSKEGAEFVNHTELDEWIEAWDEHEPFTVQEHEILKSWDRGFWLQQTLQPYAKECYYFNCDSAKTANPKTAGELKERKRRRDQYWQDKAQLKLKTWSGDEEKVWQDMCQLCDGREELLESLEEYRHMTMSKRRRIRQYTQATRLVREMQQQTTLTKPTDDQLRELLKRQRICALETDKTLQPLIDFALRGLKKEPAPATSISHPSSVPLHAAAPVEKKKEEKAPSSSLPTSSMPLHAHAPVEKKKEEKAASSSPPAISTPTATAAAVETWSVAQVCYWLSSPPLSLGKYASQFSEQEVDGKLLLALTVEELRDELHVKLSLERKRILNAIEQIKTEKNRM